MGTDVQRYMVGCPSRFTIGLFCSMLKGWGFFFTGFDLRLPNTQRFFGGETSRPTAAGEKRGTAGAFFHSLVRLFVHLVSQSVLLSTPINSSSLVSPVTQSCVRPGGFLRAGVEA